MNIHLDRREIAPLLLEHFPEMAGQSSESWHAFLNRVTGLEIALQEENATAFDRWREALAAMDIPVWVVTAAQAEAMKRHGAELAALASRARESQAERTAREMQRIRGLMSVAGDVRHLASSDS